MDINYQIQLAQFLNNQASINEDGEIVEDNETNKKEKKKSQRELFYLDLKSKKKNKKNKVI
jgi:hypothetical protein|tara:strand:+ start:4016 stop:4198 length:183 start_codon:yes stop_codon:yes gene_type:complete